MLSDGGSVGGRALPLLVPTPLSATPCREFTCPGPAPTLCPGLPLTGPFVSCATLSRLCPDTLFHPQPGSAGPCPVPARPYQCFQHC